MSEKNNELHKPVLLKEVLEALQVDKLAHLKNARFIDATVGFGGHAEAIIEAGGYILGIDADNKSLDNARDRLTIASKSQKPIDNLNASPEFFTLIKGNFKDIDRIALNAHFDNVDGILFDLGVATPQLTSNMRGISFQNKNAQLDMRLDPVTQAVTAADLIKVLDKTELFKLFNQVLDYTVSKKLTAAIVKEREFKPILTVRDLLLIIERIIPSKKGLHPATLPFMALRMAVNSELQNIKEALPKAFSILAKNARLVVISFHSGEDRIVKEFIKETVKDGLGIAINKKPIVPKTDEIEGNPSSRSAKMRVIQKYE